MGSRDQQPREAYVEDVDEQSGNAMRSTRRSASTKEKPKVSQRERERAQKSQSDSGYSTGIVAGSEASSPDTPFRETQVEVVTERERERERGDRRKSSSSGRNARRSSSRPPSAHGTRLPKGMARADDPTHYGKNPAAPSAPVVSQPIPLRPRTLSSPHRPNSYHQAYAGNNYPPLSASAHYTPHPFAAPPFASPSPQYTHYASPSLLRQPHPQPQPDYFQQPRTIEYMQPRSLESRFVEPARSASAFGTRPPPARSQAFDPYIADYHDDGYLSATGGGGAGATIQRGGSVRDSIRIPSKLSRESRERENRESREREDYERMPPPPLPIVRRAPELPAPTHPTDLDAYRDTRLQYREEPRPRRPSSNRHSVSYDLGADVERVRVEPASSSRRRQSYYGQSAPSASTNSSGYEDKIREAASYQEEVAGPTAPLTAELLKKQQRQRRQAGSSRSTKSSGSRDESDYRKSATTRSSGPEDENVTIKVTGQARVVVRGAQIDCADGGEIEIKRQPKAIRNGSERSNSEYGGPRSDERRSRIDRPILSNATRTSSQHSYVRMPPPFAGGWL